MKRAHLKFYLAGISVVFHCFFLSNLAGADRLFIYDSEGRRDPFVPLLDRTSPTGLRIILIAPRQELELPLDIKVKGILWNEQEYFAIINDEVLRQGQRLGEVKIKTIGKDMVTVEYRQKEFTIFLRKEIEQ